MIARIMRATPVFAVLLAATGQSQAFLRLDKNALLPLPGLYRGTTLGDLDGDGNLDALVFGNPSLAVFLNTGSGIFADDRGLRIPRSSNGTPNAVLGDIDGDGDLDAALSGLLRILVNDGTGNLVDESASRLPNRWIRIGAAALLDIERDGDLDLAAAGDAGLQDRLYRNDGGGRFTDVTATQMPVDSDDGLCLAWADVDGDRDLDLWVGGWVTCRLLLNDGQGAFRFAPTSFVWPGGPESASFGDVDSDGDQDLAVSGFGTLRVYDNDGSGGLAWNASRLPPGAGGWTHALTDLDGDADLDILAEGTSARGLYLNQGNGMFTDGGAGLPAALTGTLAVGDLDRDGDLDAVTGTGTDPLLVLRNDGSARFTPVVVQHQLPAVTQSTMAFACADVDGDRDVDFFTANGLFYPELTRLFLNDGRGFFAAAPFPQGTELSRAALAADFDRDGDPDLVVGNTTADRYYLNDGFGGFSDASAWIPWDGLDTRSLVAGDFDADGDLDLIAAAFAGQTRLLANYGPGRFYDVTSSAMPVGQFNTESVAMGDVDGDGDLDLVLGNNGQQSGLYLNDGGGRFNDATAGRLPTRADDTHAAVLFDLDGDNDLDLALGNETQPSRLYANDGVGRFADHPGGMPFPPIGVQTLATADVDEDGDLDLVSGGSRNRGWGLRVFHNVAGALGSGTSYYGSGSSLAVCDLDLDDDPDVLVGDPSMGRVELWTNMLRQLQVPASVPVGRMHVVRLWSFGAAGIAHVLVGGATLAPPVRLGSFGWLALGSPIFASAPLPVPSGLWQTSFVIGVPLDPSLVGVALPWQAALAVPALHLTGFDAEAWTR